MKVFLSAVSAQFKSCRNELASDLRAIGCEVVVQEDLQQHPRTLLEKLQRHVDQCDRVVAIVGDAFGIAPDMSVLPADASRRSYTQWEYFFARGERLDLAGRKWGEEEARKDIFVYFASETFLSQHPVDQADEEATLQREFVDFIRKSNEDRGKFDSADQLCRLVLRDGWQIQERPPHRPMNLPYPSLGTLFKGRDEFLRQLRESLRKAGNHQATAIVGKALYGLGGVGKTRLAVEYAWQHANDYTALLFVTGDTPEALRRNLAELCGPLVLDLPEQQRPEEEVRFAAAVRWLQQHPGWFLILDNLDSEPSAAAAEQLLKRLSGGHVVLTSRLANWSGSVEPLALDVLTVEDAVDFLVTRTASKRRHAADDPQQARELAVELGQLALALEQAGAYICQRRLTLAVYRTAWQEQHDKVIAWFDEREMKYPRSVAVTWQTTVQRLSDAARKLLQILAWFGPEAIPESLLESYPGVEGTSADGSAGASPSHALDPDRATAREGEAPAEPPARNADPYDLLAELDAWSLVTRQADSPTFSVHRLVQDVTRRSLRADPEHTSLLAALGWINGAFESDWNNVVAFLGLEPLLGHGTAVASYADQGNITEPTTRLMICVAHIHRAKAEYQQAEPLMRRALAIVEQSYGAEHLNVAIKLNNLALLLQETNRLAEAEPLYRRALAIDEQSYGAEHPRVAIRLNNLAALLKATNRRAEAEPLMRRALAIVDQSYGAEHPNVAICLNNLAQLLQATNRLAEAEPLMRRALAIDEQSFGDEHPNVAIRLNNLALLLQDTNRLAEAEPLMRRAVDILRASLGEEHPNTVTAVENYRRLREAMD